MKQHEWQEQAKESETGRTPGVGQAKPGGEGSCRGWLVIHSLVLVLKRIVFISIHRVGRWQLVASGHVFTAYTLSWTLCFSCISPLAFIFTAATSVGVITSTM